VWAVPTVALVLPSVGSFAQAPIARATRMKVRACMEPPWMRRQYAPSLLTARCQEHLVRVALKGATMSNPIAYAELHTPNAARAKEFYRTLFDWKLEDVMDGRYTMIHPGEGVEGGLMADDFAGWQMYVSVTDLAAATRRAKE